MVACSRGSCIVQNHAQMLINMVKILLTLSLAFHLKYQWLPFPIRNMHGYSYYCFQNLASYHSSNLFICNFCMVLIFSACSYMCNKTVHNMMTIKDSAYHVTLLVVFGFGILCIDNCILMHQYKNACSSSIIFTSCSIGAVRITQSLLVDSQSWGYMTADQVNRTIMMPYLSDFSNSLLAIRTY